MRSRMPPRTPRRLTLMIKPSNGSPNMSTGETRAPAAPQIESISAVTLATHDMAQAVRFYFIYAPKRLLLAAALAYLKAFPSR